jgi:hypothetical protein
LSTLIDSLETVTPLAYVRPNQFAPDTLLPNHDLFHFIGRLTWTLQVIVIADWDPKEQLLRSANIKILKVTQCYISAPHPVRERPMLHVENFALVRSLENKLKVCKKLVDIPKKLY